MAPSSWSLTRAPSGAGRFRDILGAHVADLGGADLLSEAQMQLCRRAAALALECERMEGDLADGKDVDLDLLNRLCGGLGRLYERVGIKRVASDRTPTIADLMARHQP